MPRCVERICASCTQTFFALLSEVKRGAAKYCSRPCRDRARVVPLEVQFQTHGNGVPTENGCILWTGTFTTNGYGRLNSRQSGRNRFIQANRYVWERAHGPIPEGMEVCHNCPGGDNPACVNIAHLFLGTHHENMADMAAKGRNRKGERCNLSKLTEETVREIRERHRAGGVTQKQLAAEYGTSHANVCMIVNRTNWKHID
jgi:hypothetical protein